MGTIRKGALGGFSGKAGSVVGSSWRDINYIKGLPKLSNKPKSEKQLEQQARFAMALRTLLPVKDYLNVGFNDLKQGRRTGFNVALQAFLEKAITGIYPALDIDYAMIEFARGSISFPADVLVTPEAGKLVVDWNTQALKAKADMEDQFTVLVYEPNSNDYVVGPPLTLRTTGTVDVVMPSDWAGLTVHVYAYFINKNGKDVSKSIYAGTAIVM